MQVLGIGYFFSAQDLRRVGWLPVRVDDGRREGKIDCCCFLLVGHFLKHFWLVSFFLLFVNFFWQL